MQFLAPGFPSPRHCCQTMGGLGRILNKEEAPSIVVLLTELQLKPSCVGGRVLITLGPVKLYRLPRSMAITRSVNDRMCGPGSSPSYTVDSGELLLIYSSMQGESAPVFGIQHQ